MEKPESLRRARRRARLRELIDANGGQTQVALEIGTPKSHLSAMLSGKRGLGDELAEKLEKHYGKPPGWFDAFDSHMEFQVYEALQFADFIEELTYHPPASDVPEWLTRVHGADREYRPDFAIMARSGAMAFIEVKRFLMGPEADNLIAAEIAHPSEFLVYSTGDREKRPHSGLAEQIDRHLEAHVPRITAPSFERTLVREESPTYGPNIGGGVPLISSVQAGSFKEHVDNFHPGDGGMELIPTTIPVQRYTFALRVSGDSMEPEFTDGMILIIEPELEPNPGDYVVAKNGDDETTFKQLTKDGGDWYLKPLNPRYPIKPLGENRIIGVLRAVEKRYR